MHTKRKATRRQTAYPGRPCAQASFLENRANPELPPRPRSFRKRSQQQRSRGSLSCAAGTGGRGLGNLLPGRSESPASGKMCTSKQQLVTGRPSKTEIGIKATRNIERSQTVLLLQTLVDGELEEGFLYEREGERSPGPRDAVQ